MRLRPSPRFLDHLNTSFARQAHHVRRPARTGEGDDQIGLAFIKDLLIARQSGRAAVLERILLDRELLNRDAPRDCPLPCRRVRATRSAVDDDGEGTTALP
jgi:CBS domain containing-hemolysin-like protein